MDTGTEVIAIFERLKEGNVIEETSAGRIVFTDEFRRAREQYRQEAESAGTSEYFAEVSENTAEQPVGHEAVDDDVLADAVGIREVCDDIDPATSVQVARSLRRGQAASRKSGIPDGFLPLSVAEIETFIGQHPASLLYFWREDCPPCDVLRDELETLVRDRDLPEELGLGTVYGPEDPEVLDEEYDIAVAPTLLFCSRSGIDSRLVGTAEPAAIRTELDILLQEHLG